MSSRVDVWGGWNKWIEKGSCIDRISETNEKKARNFLVVLTETSYLRGALLKWGKNKEREVSCLALVVLSSVVKLLSTRHFRLIDFYYVQVSTRMSEEQITVERNEF